jgi:hypothetical protein
MLKLLLPLMLTLAFLLVAFWTLTAYRQKWRGERAGEWSRDSLEIDHKYYQKVHKPYIFINGKPYWEKSLPEERIENARH